MADLNARIIAKASGTASEVPQAADLEVAELAVNTADAKLFTKHTDGSVVEIASGGGAVSSVNTQTGAVSLGVQDMNDYELVAGSNFEYTVGDSNTSGGASQGSLSGAQAMFFNRTDSNGLTFDENDFPATGTIYFSNDDSTYYSEPYTYRADFTNASRVCLETDAWTASNAGVPSGTIYFYLNSPPTVALADGNILQWVAADSKFKPSTAVSAINDLSDVDTATAAPTDGQVLTWSNADSEWQPADASGAVSSVNSQTGTVSLDAQDLADVAPPTPLVWDNNFNGGNVLSIGSGGGGGFSAINSGGYYQIQVSFEDADGADRENWLKSATAATSMSYYIDGVLVGTDTCDARGQSNSNDRVYFGWTAADNPIYLAVAAASADATFSVQNNTDPRYSAGVATEGSVLQYDGAADKYTVVDAKIQSQTDFALNTTGSILFYDQIVPYNQSGNAGDFLFTSGFVYISSIVSNGANQDTYIGGKSGSTPAWFSQDGVTYIQDTDVLLSSKDAQGMYSIPVDTAIYNEVSTWSQLFVTFDDPTPTSLAEGDTLQWDDTDKKFKPSAFTAAGVRTLLGIGEYVDDAAAGTGGVASGALYYNTTSSDYRLKS